MKKTIVLTLALSLVLSLTACGKSGNDGADEKSEGVMTYAEYMAAELDSEVVIETYVQAKQSWWEDKATLYTQDQDGAYFIYSAVCSEADYEKLTPGTKIKVTGYTTEWSGEVEVAEGAAIEILDGSYTASAADVTDLLGKDELIDHQNQLVSFKGMTVETYEKDGESYDCAFVYNDDNSGSSDSNSDLYFNVSKDGQTYTLLRRVLSLRQQHGRLQGCGESECGRYG